MSTRNYGWKRDDLDHRDRVLPQLIARFPLPDSVDLRGSGFMPPVYDQGQLGACTGHAIAAAVDFQRKKQGESFIAPSRLFIYYNEREMEGTVDQDSGAQIRDGIKSIVSLGVCPESEWPYSDQNNQFAVKPSPQCYADALKFKAVEYSRVTQQEYWIRHCLAIRGQPIVFGFSVFEAFESDDVASTGIVPMPNVSDSPIGGHAVLAVGYDESKRLVTVRNSWGDQWGDHGYFYMPYDYILDSRLASDFWVVEGEMQTAT